MRKQNGQIFTAWEGFLKILRRGLLLFLGAVFAFTLTGCSRQGTTTSGPVTLYWWRSLADSNEAVLQELITRYQDQNPNVTIKLVLKDPRTYEQEAIDALASHQSISNAPDILSLSAADLPKYSLSLTSAPDALFTGANQANKAPVDAVSSLYVPAAAKAVTLTDPNTNTPKIYGLPIAIDTLVLYRNVDMIRSSLNNLASLNQNQNKFSQGEMDSITQKLNTSPKTWQDLVDIVPYLKVTSGTDVSQAAIAIGTAKNVERSYDILSALMMQNGTKFTSDKFDSATFNLSQSGAASQSNPGQKALEFYSRFSNPNDSLYTWNNKMPNSVSAFETGQAAMMVQFASAYRYIINEAPQMKDSIDISALPQVLSPDSTTSTDQIKVPAQMWVETAPSAKGSAAVQQAAWAFIKYVTDSKNATPYLSAQKLPSAMKVTDQDNTLFDTVGKQKTIGDLFFKGTRAENVDQIMIGMIDTFNAGKPAKDALDLAASQITTILQASKVKWASGG